MLLLMHRHQPRPTLFPYTTLFRSNLARRRRKTLSEDLEMVDERFHLRLHFLAIRRHNPGRFRADGALGRDLRHGLADDLRSEEHTSELQSPMYLVCRLLLEKKNST